MQAYYMSIYEPGEILLQLICFKNNKNVVFISKQTQTFWYRQISKFRYWDWKWGSLHPNS